MDIRSDVYCGFWTPNTQLIKKLEFSPSLPIHFSYSTKWELDNILALANFYYLGHSFTPTFKEYGRKKPSRGTGLSKCILYLGLSLTGTLPQLETQGRQKADGFQEQGRTWHLQYLFISFLHGLYHPSATCWQTGLSSPCGSCFLLLYTRHSEDLPQTKDHDKKMLLCLL